ncbi:unnamed protein product [Cercospora beticola]|nr:unnamed protein product [Cercospora beticola]
MYLSSLFFLWSISATSVAAAGKGGCIIAAGYPNGVCQCSNHPGGAYECYASSPCSTDTSGCWCYEDGYAQCL